jgi:hypothetical protein
MTDATSMHILAHHQNLGHYRRLLAEPNVADDLVRYNLLSRLLADEEARETKSHEHR